ncbi:hypothetical protein D3C85_1731150 [compost metagenome]
MACWTLSEAPAALKSCWASSRNWSASEASPAAFRDLPSNSETSPAVCLARTLRSAWISRSLSTAAGMSPVRYSQRARMKATSS